MKHKVKICSSIYEDRLEDEINKWFEDQKEGQKKISIIDIKYSTSQSGNVYSSHSALIHYMEVNNANFLEE